MSFVRWDPFRNVSALQDRINRLFEDAFPAEKAVDGEIQQSAWKPLVDVYETENALIITAELPGVRKDDLSVEIKDNLLTLKGVRYVDEALKDQTCLRRERQFGFFMRAFTLESSVDPEKIKAKFKTGVLTVEVPKPKADQLKKVNVTVE